MGGGDEERKVVRGARARALVIAALAVVAFVPIAAWELWGAYGAVQELASEAPERVELFVVPDGFVLFGHAYTDADAERVLSGLASERPGIELRVVANDLRDPRAARLSFVAFQNGLDAAVEQRAFDAGIAVAVDAGHDGGLDGGEVIDAGSDAGERDAGTTKQRRGSATARRWSRDSEECRRARERFRNHVTECDAEGNCDVPAIPPPCR